MLQQMFEVTLMFGIVDNIQAVCPWLTFDHGLITVAASWKRLLCRCHNNTVIGLHSLFIDKCLVVTMKLHDAFANFDVYSLALDISKFLHREPV